MKKTTPYLLVAACILGIMAFSPKLIGTPSCCGKETAPSVTDTTATPDLLTTCPVSGEKLDGDMGKPFVFTYNNQEVKLCCKSCKKDFDKNPDKYIAKIRAADKK